MALKKTLPVVGGFTAEYIKISEHTHKVDEKFSETYLTIWKDDATRLAALAGDTTKVPIREPIRVRITEATEFDLVFPTRYYSEAAVYNAIKTGIVKCDYYFGSDTRDTPAHERMLYGAEDV